ncbi:MAG TPA: GAF domain-containing protein [Anaerolineales bacterium]|nr:GAF domain-containing protein [Anaerolineales bacterium]
MLSRFLNYFRDEEDSNPSFIQMTRNILIFVILINLFLLPLVIGLFGEESRNIPAFFVLSINLILEIISLYYAIRGKVGMAKLIVPLALIAAIAIIAVNTNGLRDISIVGLPLVLVIAALLLGKRAMWGIAPIAIITALVIAVLDLTSGRTITKVGIDDAIIIIVLLVGCSAIIQALINRLTETINKLQKNEKIQLEENRELNELRQSLEERVNQRTAELDTANQFNLRRARQFEAISQVVKAISSIQDLDTLMPRITQVISEQFNTYHTGIFLLDNEREFAVLRASNSMGGQKMLERGHKLQVGQTGIVGFVTATGRARIALDVGTDAAYFDNPDLPGTRSEIALPLRYSGQIIGALDVQSLDANAFGQDDIEALTTLADQVAVTINNTLILEEARKSLNESQSAFGNFTRDSWKIMQPKSLGLGFQLKESVITPLDQPLTGKHIQEAVASGATVISDKDNGGSNLTIPIRLRGKTIGIINLRTAQQKLTSDDADIAESVTERLSLAIETALLIQTTQHRADVERITSDISSRINSSTRFETILQTAAQELSRALGGSDVLVQIEPASIELGMAG